MDPPASPHPPALSDPARFLFSAVLHRRLSGMAGHGSGRIGPGTDRAGHGWGRTSSRPTDRSCRRPREWPRLRAPRTHRATGRLDRCFFKKEELGAGEAWRDWGMVRALGCALRRADERAGLGLHDGLREPKVRYFGIARHVVDEHLPTAPRLYLGIADAVPSAMRRAWPMCAPHAQWTPMSIRKFGVARCCG